MNKTSQIEIPAPKRVVFSLKIPPNKHIVRMAISVSPWNLPACEEVIVDRGRTSLLAKSYMINSMLCMAIPPNRLPVTKS